MQSRLIKYSSSKSLNTEAPGTLRAQRVSLMNEKDRESFFVEVIMNFSNGDVEMLMFAPYV